MIHDIFNCRVKQTNQYIIHMFLYNLISQLYIYTILRLYIGWKPITFSTEKNFGITTPRTNLLHMFHHIYIVYIYIYICFILVQIILL
jgi:hypothetical protein